MTVVYKVTCTECGWTGSSNEMLESENPFKKGDIINACPMCKTVDDSIQVACDEPDCFEPVTCGTPSDKGYRQTCPKHKPEAGK